MKINPRYLKALLPIAAHQDIRYYLNGVLLETSPEGGKTYVSTDGKRMAIFHEEWDKETPEAVSIIIPREVIQQMVVNRAMPHNGTLTRLDDRKWTLDTFSEASLNFTPIDGRYPDWRSVVPKEMTPEMGDYNISFLADFATVAKEAGMNVREIGLLLWQNGSNQALLTSTDRNFVGILMPVNARSEKSGGVQIPKWLRRDEPVTA